MVVVIGAGLAGLSAAIHLAERGVEVTLCEAHPRFLGGRTRGRESYAFDWKGESHVHTLDHGQHCMWFQYYNMRALMRRLSLLHKAARHCEYACYIVDDGTSVKRPVPFDVNPDRTPPTILHFLQHLGEATRMSRWRGRDALQLLRAMPRMLTALSFAHASDYDQWDELSIAEFFAWVGLPAQTDLILKSLCKASTFHPHTEISASWGLSMMESTMLAHPADHTMWCFRGNLGTHLIDPLAEAFRARGGKILKNAKAVGVRKQGERICAVELEPTSPQSDVAAEVLQEAALLSCDAVICATDIPGFRSFALPSLAHHEDLRRAANLETVANVTLRAITQRRLPDTEPWLGLFTGRFHFLDAYFLVSHYQDEFIEWSRRTGGEVLELHSYLAQREIEACPPELVRREVERELVRAWPELAGQIAHIEYFVNERTFDKQGVGGARHLPRMQTSVPNLLLCGSWVRVDAAVHDMEKAVVTGMEAANALLAQQGLRPFPVIGLRPKSRTQRLLSRLDWALPRPAAARRRGVAPSAE